MLGGEASGVDEKHRAENPPLAVRELHQHHVEHLELEKLRVCKPLEPKLVQLAPEGALILLHVTRDHRLAVVIGFAYAGRPAAPHYY